MEGSIRIGARVARSRTNGPGERYVVWTQGCARGCPGCSNQQFASTDGGVVARVSELFREVQATPGIDGLTVSGGEPFDQAAPVGRLAEFVRSMGLSVLCYSGFTFEELKASPDPAIARLLWATDILVDGPFVSALSEAAPAWCGSVNQRFLLLRDGEVVQDASSGPVAHPVEVEISGNSVNATGIGARNAVRNVADALERDFGISFR